MAIFPSIVVLQVWGQRLHRSRSKVTWVKVSLWFMILAGGLISMSEFGFWIDSRELVLPILTISLKIINYNRNQMNHSFSSTKSHPMSWGWTGWTPTSLFSKSQACNHPILLLNVVPQLYALPLCQLSCQFLSLFIFQFLIPSMEVGVNGHTDLRAVNPVTEVVKCARERVIIRSPSTEVGPAIILDISRWSTKYNFVMKILVQVGEMDFIFNWLEMMYFWLLWYPWFALWFPWAPVLAVGVYLPKDSMRKAIHPLIGLWLSGTSGTCWSPGKMLGKWQESFTKIRGLQFVS